MLSQGIVLLHDNPSPHSVRATENLIEKLGWEQFDHPTYSPDLAPSDLCTSFLNLKLDFGGRHFVSDDDAKTVFSSDCLQWLHRFMKKESKSWFPAKQMSQQ